MWNQMLTLVLVVAGVVHSSSAAVHCQPGDEGCAKCQASCDAIPLTALPECCEAFSACCPTYSQACGHCNANAAIDPHFPEYCCASFTDCCDKVPGLNVVSGFNGKQGSKIPSKDALSKGMQKHPRSASPDEPHPEPEPVADAASAPEAVSEVAPPAARTEADTATSSQPAAPEEVTRSSKPTVISRPAQDETQDLEVEGRAPAAAESRGRSRTRGDANLQTASTSTKASAPALVSGRASSTVSRAPSASTGRGSSPRAEQISPGPVSPAGVEDVVGPSQSPSPQIRSRQATVVSRRNRPTEADRKVIAAASFDRKGRMTSRGRVV